MKKCSVLFIVLAGFVLFTGCAKKVSTDDLSPGLYASLETSKGDIVIKLEYQKMPLFVVNFIGLAEGILKNDLMEGSRYYDGAIFDKVSPNNLIKGGTTHGKNQGGPGYTLPLFFHPELRHDRFGVVSMQRNGQEIDGRIGDHHGDPLEHLRFALYGDIWEGNEQDIALADDDLRHAGRTQHGMWHEWREGGILYGKTGAVWVVDCGQEAADRLVNTLDLVRVGVHGEGVRAPCDLHVRGSFRDARAICGKRASVVQYLPRGDCSRVA